MALKISFRFIGDPLFPAGRYIESVDLCQAKRKTVFFSPLGEAKSSNM
jgi:hypothetical protein